MRRSVSENDVPHHAEARCTPGTDEQVGLVPAVEAEAERAVLQDAVHFGERGPQPGIIVVVGNGPAVARAVPAQVWRISKDESTMQRARRASRRRNHRAGWN